MPTPRDLTKGQKETLKKLLLKQKEWEKSKAAIKTAKKTNKPTKTKKPNQTKKPKTVRV